MGVIDFHMLEAKPIDFAVKSACKLPVKKLDKIDKPRESLEEKVYTAFFPAVTMLSELENVDPEKMSI